MQAHEISAILSEFIIEQFLDGDGADLHEDTPLLEWGVIDSIAMFTLLRFIKERFAIEIPDTAVSPRNFHSIEVLQRLVSKLQEEQGGGAGDA
ncbi:MAG: acyl carrier protein [Myxococcales bacterium]|nr:acyl carrier protein [Myxococcales bacterium]MCA9696359.1 acyl carrier protein [Myxococcales bacterium]